MRMIIKGLLAGIWLLLIPAAAGLPLLRKKETVTLSESFMAGYLALFSLMEVLALPMIFFEMPLHILTGVYGALAVLLALAGCVCLKKRMEKREVCPKDLYPAARKAIKNTSGWFWAAAVLILLQMAAVAVFAHFDADDVMYVGAATTAVQTDTIFSISPYTGYAYSSLPARYILSPFPVFLAVASQLCGGLHPAIMAHMIFPPVFLLMAYAVQNLLAKKWFPEKKDAQGIYLMFTAILTWFSAYSIYSAGNFQMVRIWQGKALLAAALLPFLLYLCLSLALQETKDDSWYLLLLADVSCCLVSSMGIILSALLIGIMAFAGMIYRKKLSIFFKMVLCCLPSLILGVIYLGIK